MSNNYIPSKDAVFIIWVKTLIAYIVSHVTTWDLDEKRVKELSDGESDFDLKYGRATDPATRTPVAIESSRESHKLLEGLVRKFVSEFIRNSSKITHEDLKAMGLPIPDTHPTPHKPLIEQAQVEIKIINQRELGVTIVDVQSPSLHHRPLDSSRIKLVYSVSDTPITDLDTLGHAIVSPRIYHELIFSPSDQHRSLYLVARYENSRGNGCPWSDILHTQVPYPPNVTRPPSLPPPNPAALYPGRIFYICL
jgi:hypothetical protein